VDAACREISKRGIELDGHAFRDPDDRRVELIQLG
jgi:hypothetical protein